MLLAVSASATVQSAVQCSQCAVQSATFALPPSQCVSPMSGPSGSSASAGVQLQSSPSSLPSLLPAPPVLSTSFKGVLPPMHVRDYRKIKFEDLNKWKL